MSPYLLFSCDPYQKDPPSIVMFSRVLVVPEQLMTCVLPAQSLRNNEPISRAPGVAFVRTPEDSVARLKQRFLMLNHPSKHLPF